MFEFFATIFNKVISAVASVIVAIGLISAPTPVSQDVNFTPIPEQTQAVIDVGKTDFKKKDAPVKRLEELEKARLETERANWETEKARFEAEAIKAKAETERLLNEERARKATEAHRQLELQQQRLLEEQARQLELQRQQAAQRALDEQRQNEQTRINQINSQIQALLSEYNVKIAAIDRQILAVEQKYYADVKNVRSQPIPMDFISGQIQKLAQEVDFETNQLQLEKEALKLEYQRRIRELESQL